MRFGKKLGAIAAIATSCALIGATDASASSRPTDAASRVAGGEAQYRPSGQDFYITDWVRDGKGVKVQYKVAKHLSGLDGANPVSKVWGGGFNDGHPYRWARDLPDTYYVKFRVGLSNNGHYVRGTYGSWKIATTV